MFEGSLFQMTLMDQTVIAYILMNKYWDAYIEILSYSYLMKNGYQIENENWHKLMEGTTKKIDLAFKNILQTMTKKKVNKSVVETEADKTRAEMMQWANQVSRGRIQADRNIPAIDWNPEEEITYEVVEETEEPIF